MSSRSAESSMDRLHQKEWRYAADGLSARTEDGSAEMSLTMRPKSDSDQFAPFHLSFRNAVYEALIPVRRHWYRRLIKPNGEQETFPCWRAVYDEIDIVVAGQARIRASQLGRDDWCSFDELFFSALANWPSFASPDNFDRNTERYVTKTVSGGHLLRGWEPALVRSMPGFLSPSYEVPKYKADPNYQRSVEDLARNGREWRQVVPPEVV